MGAAPVASKCSADGLCDPADWTCVLPHGHQYRVKMSVDFIDVCLVLSKPAHPRFIMKMFGPGAHHRDPDLLPGNVALRFTVRVIDPMSADALRRGLSILQHRDPGASYRLGCTELSMDLSRNGADLAELAGLTAKLWRHAKNKPQGQRRFITDPDGPLQVKRVVYSFSDLLEVFDNANYTGYIGFQGGHKPDPVSLRIYTKITDRGGALPKHRWSSRMEVTLQGSSMPFQTIEEAEAYSFEELACWFKFVRFKPKEEINKFARIAISWTADLAPRYKTQEAARADGVPRKPSGVARIRIADPLGQATYAALKTLSRQWRSK